jgi:hypothetical protein
MAARKIAERLSAMDGRMDGSERTGRDILISDSSVRISNFKFQILDLRFSNNPSRAEGVTSIYELTRSYTKTAPGFISVISWTRWILDVLILSSLPSLRFEDAGLGFGKTSAAQAANSDAASENQKPTE